MKYQLILLFLLFFIAFPLVNAQDLSPASKWMKSGAYAEYQFNSTVVVFPNSSKVTFDSPTPATFRWHCVEINESIAKLNISLCINHNNFNQFRLVDVNIVNGEVQVDGVFVGVTFLWGPTNIVNGSQIILWNNSVEKVTGNVTLVGNGKSPQESQKIYIVKANGTVLGKIIDFVRFYDLDKGILTDGHITDDVMFSLLGVKYIGFEGEMTFVDTNIDLGAGEQLILIINDQDNVIYYLLLPIAFLITIFLVIYGFRKKKCKNKKKEHR